MGKIKQFAGKSLLKLFGWKMTGLPPKDKKYVCIVAPHTSIKDMFIGKWYNWAHNMEPKIIMKQEFFFFPLGIIVRRWGAIPIDRSKAANVVDQMAKHFAENDEFTLAITPEGTRKINHKWKTGFYRIAQKAGVPLHLTYIDFKTKEVGFMPEFKMSGDIKADMPKIQLRYKGIYAAHVNLFSIGEGIPVFENKLDNNKD